MFEGYIITPKRKIPQIHKMNKMPFHCLYKTNELEKENTACRYTEFSTNCNQCIVRYKSMDGKTTSYYQRFKTVPFKKLKDFEPKVVSSKNALNTKYGDIQLCPKCFPNGIENEK